MSMPRPMTCLKHFSISVCHIAVYYIALNPVGSVSGLYHLAQCALLELTNAAKDDSHSLLGIPVTPQRPVIN